MSVLTAMCAVAMMVSRQEGTCTDGQGQGQGRQCLLLKKKQRMQGETGSRGEREETGRLKDGVHR
jgi:hypothetical protein